MSFSRTDSHALYLFPLSLRFTPGRTTWRALNFVGFECYIFFSLSLFGRSFPLRIVEDNIVLPLLVLFYRARGFISHPVALGAGCGASNERRCLDVDTGVALLAANFVLGLCGCLRVVRRNVFLPGAG